MTRPITASYLSQHTQISILVATWNCVGQLEHFLNSLFHQTFCDWELILLDNVSKDGTAELIRSFQAKIQRPQNLIWTSQPDSGIYDAWNRGLRLARGRYLCFIGADDIFIDDHSLARILPHIYADHDLITARNAYYSPRGHFLRCWGSGWNWSRMRQSMNIAHPGMLIKRGLFERFGSFDASYRICGDYEWFLRLPPSLSSVHTTDTILKVVQAGVSHTRIGLVYSETFSAQRRHIGLWLSCLFWLLNWAKYLRRRLIGLA